MTEATLAARERRELSDLLIRVGPDHPTICLDGWTTYDLAAHVVAREHRLDCVPGYWIDSLRPYSLKVQANYRKRPYESLVQDLRTGPPWWSPFAFPGADAKLNTLEYFVHLEDVLRAGDKPHLRELSAADQDELWSRFTRGARLILSGRTTPLRLVRPDGTELAAGPVGKPMRVVGEPSELIMYAYGRESSARVEIINER